MRFSPYGAAFLTDSIIAQRYVELEGELKRGMAVVKVRSSAHGNAWRLYHVIDKVSGSPSRGRIWISKQARRKFDLQHEGRR